MAGRLIEPKVITDFNQELVCVLPKGFWFDDVRWQRVWAAFDENCDLEHGRSERNIS